MKKPIVWMLIVLLGLLMGCTTKTPIVPPQTNLTREEAITIAQKYVDGAYGLKTEGSPVNATESVYGGLAIWNVTMTDLQGLPPPTGMLPPTNGAPPPKPYTLIGVGNIVLDMKTGEILTAAVGTRIVYLDQ